MEAPRRASSVLCAAITLAALAAACTSDDVLTKPDARSPIGDASHDVRDVAVPTGDAPSGEDGDAPTGPTRYDPIPSPFDGELGMLARGEYLARHVAGCVDCHSPKLPDGSVDEARLLSGIENLFDLAPDEEGVGAVHSRNLTPHPTTGLGGWNDVEIRRAITTGFSRGDAALHPVMPYWAFAVMTDEDLDAIVAYLRSVPAVDRAVPPREELPMLFGRPARPLELDELPPTSIAAGDPSRAEADRGRYLAAIACLNCHTETDSSADPPVRLDALFAGRRKLMPYSFGLASEGSPFIESKNLTPHESGIADYAAQDVRIAVKRGLTRDALPLCPPMPVGPDGAFGHLRDDDAAAIGTYLVSIPPRDSGKIDDCCVACHTPDGILDVDNPL